MDLNSTFRDDVEQLMSKVPVSRVVTYGDLAGLAGHANAARIVGGIAHFGNPELPWHRLVNRFGRLAKAYPGGITVQAQLLESEGITVTDFIVDNFESIRTPPRLTFYQPFLRIPKLKLRI